MIYNEELYRIIIESSQDLIWILDEKGKFTFFNKRCKEKDGTDLSCIIGKDYFSLIHREDVERVQDIFRKTMKGDPQTYEVASYDTQGNDIFLSVCTVPLVNEGKIKGTVSFGRDITEKKKMEESLKESEERFRCLVEQSPFGIEISSEGKFVYMNLAGARIFGAVNPEELIGKARMDFIHPDFQHLVRERIQLEEKGKKVPFVEEKWIRLDGSIIDVEIISIPFIFNRKFSIYGVFQDITNRKKHEEICLENKKLFLASKAKSEFIATLSHEIRTPLTSIMGFSELLKDKAIAGELNEKAEHFVDKVISNSNHLLELLNDILDIDKIEAGKLEIEIEKFSLHDAVEEVLLLMEEIAAKRNILIKKDLTPIEIYADKRRIKQILLNILSNALKFSKQDGGIVTINTIISGDMVSVSISDTGIGIKKEDIPRLFWSFEQLDSGMSRKYGGTGLGLAISDKLAKLHGGRIEVNSEYGKGSTFILMLPLTIEKQCLKK